MPRVARNHYDGGVYHILNRAVMKQKIFHTKRDYEKIVQLFMENKDKYKLKIYGYCIMPNHFHMVVKIGDASIFSSFMQKVMSNYATWYNAKYKRAGHLWQGRYKSFRVQADLYLFTLMRYVEANPVRAMLVKSAKDWPYSSLNHRIDQPPVELPATWQKDLDEPINPSELKKIQNSIEKQAKIGRPKKGENNMSKKLCKCGGQIKEYDKLYECEQCKSKVWKNSFGHEFKEGEAYKLLQGQTVMIRALRSQSGNLYDTKAKIVDKGLQLIFDDETKSTKMCQCDCGAEVIKIPKGYKCTGCEKIVWEKFVSHTLKLPQIKQLYKGESLYLKDLKSKKGNTFNAEIFFEGQEISMQYLN